MNLWLAVVLSCVALLQASTDKERHLRLEFDDVAAHATALIQVVDEMEASFQQQGLTLHPDIASARDHLVVTMDAASRAMEKHDWNHLRKCLDRARGWIEQLRRKL